MSNNTERLTALATTGQPKQVVELGFGSGESFEMLQRAAALLCSSTLVPQQFRGRENLPNCVVALNMANRIGADPLMVMQNLYVVHGRPSWSAASFTRSWMPRTRSRAIRRAAMVSGPRRCWLVAGLPQRQVFSLPFSFTSA